MPWDSFGFVLWQYPDYLDFHFACNCTTDAAISTPNTTSVSLPPPGDECFASCHLEILHIQCSDAQIFNLILMIVDYLLVLPKLSNVISMPLYVLNIIMSHHIVILCLFPLILLSNLEDPSVKQVISEY